MSAGRRHYGELLEAGVKIYERQGALLHAKTTLIDGVWSAVGSTNLDWRSFLHNDEIDAIVLSAALRRPDARGVPGRPGAVEAADAGEMVAAGA